MTKAPVLPAARREPARVGGSWLTRLGSRPATPDVLAPARPGLALMAAVDEIAADIRQHLPGDPYLRRLFIRYDGLLREGEGVEAQRELVAIDHYVATRIHDYARLRRRANPQLRISASTATCCVAYGPDRRARAHIIFGLTCRGHEARGHVEITT